ncbi:Sec1-like protein [Lipomyces tetrasporus]|uniref:Sec1-like protein n=1 Tax=Lipomyces tetrasporus TaxID=54092 RepID=A0AAD7QS70_9ASCO|nr:Sec1-like protein [Lipomyces tetrasporus]KAJ8100424.1 Sec1-like protein [Lipomyces tetrasporus]
MDLFKACQTYVDKLLDDSKPAARNGVYESSGGKMKILLLDNETTPILSMISTQSLLLKNEVYLMDRLDNSNRERMRHLRCLVFVRPTNDAIQAIVDELRDPKYGEYELYFSNVVKKSALERMAEADDYEVVKAVVEVFADFLVINKDLFALNLFAPQSCIFGDAPESWNTRPFMRSVEAITGALLTLKKKPLIRYEANSPLAKSLAIETLYNIQQDPKLFDFRKMDTPPVLLILDRKNDPITPLLTPWTYQAMVHEYLGIRNGRVDLSGVPDVRADMKEIVLSPEGDSFYTDSMFKNFGDLGASIKDYVDKYQSRTKSNANIESIADMKRFVEEYPEFRKLSGNVTKHVTLVSELSRRVSQDNLLEISELEQSLACNDNHANDLKQLRIFLSQNLPDDTKIRLVALYALRYERSDQGPSALPSLLDQLSRANVSPTRLLALKTLLRYAGASERQEDLFKTDSIFSRAQSGFKGLQGVENVYTQHVTLLERTLGALVKGRLRDNLYPFIEGGGSSRDKPCDIIVFFIGGVTFEESKVIAQINASTPGLRIVVGSTAMHNSKTFLDEMEFASTKWQI